MANVEEQDIFGLIGENGFPRLAAAFYRRVPSDPVLGAMYPKEELAAAQRRLGSFLIQRFGGPNAYSQERGHPKLRMRHGPFDIGTKARDHWIALMTAAMDEVEVAPSIRAVLEPYFLNTANFMVNAIGD